MEKAGIRLLFQGVDMKPGMACAYGTAGEKTVLALSGNPASAVTNFCVCALPFIRRKCGKSVFLPKAVTAKMRNAFPKKSKSPRFLRGRVELEDGTVCFICSSGQGNAVLSSAIGCDTFMLVPAGHGPVEAGERLKGFML